MVKNLPAMQRPGFDPWVGKIPLEKGMTTYPSILIWRIPWTDKPGELQSVGFPRVGHNGATNTTLIYCLFWGLCATKNDSQIMERHSI